MNPAVKSFLVRCPMFSISLAITCLSSTALAVNLPPGGSTPLAGTTGGAGPGLVIHDNYMPFQIHGGGGALLYDGELRDRVVRLDATGTLVFIRQVRSMNGSLNGAVAEISCADYASFLTDVGYSTTSTGTVTPDFASRTPNGAYVAFQFNRTPVFGSQESKMVFINTEALDYAAGGKCIVSLVSGEQTSMPVMTPVRHIEPGCRDIDFEDIPKDTLFPSGSSFTSNGVLMHLSEFYSNVGSCTNPTPGNSARVEDGNMACGVSHELAINNVNVEFDYGVSLLGMVIDFGEYGGNINLSINGQCVSEQFFSDVPPLVGGVMVTVVEPNLGQGCGRITLQGNIQDVSIGGQELWIDNIRCEPDVCFDDQTPPVAEIDKPGSEVCVCDPLEIYGTANDDNFDQYTLEYRLTTDPMWHPITSSNTPVVTDLLGVWNAAGLPQGRYIIRLTSRDVCGHSETAIIMVWLGTTFDNLTVREPDNGDVVGGEVCVDGTVWDNYCFDKYFVEYMPIAGVMWHPVDPMNPVYTTTVINDPFAHWETIDLGLSDGDYMLRVRAYDDCGNTATDAREVIVDNTWPEAEITNPEPCACVEGVVEVFGTAFDDNLASWTLQYTGGDASSWVTVNSGNAPVIGNLLSMWDTTALRPCAYTLRLIVRDSAVINCNNAIHHWSEYTVSINVGDCGNYDFDADDDGDVDLSDYSWFEQAFTGPMVP